MPSSNEDTAMKTQLNKIQNQILLDCILRQNESDLEVNLERRGGFGINASLYGSKDKLLHTAVCTGNLSMVNTLLEKKGVNVNASGNKDLTPLHIASALPNMEAIVKALLSHGADIEAYDSNGWTPLLHAAYKGNVPILDLLVKQGARQDVKDRDNKNILHISINSCETIGHLIVFLDVEDFINEFDKMGATPLHYAASDSPGVLRMLLEAGASDSVRDGYGWSPLHYAAHSGNVKSLQALAQYNPDVNIDDDFKNRPLHVASLSAEEHMVQILLQNRASISQNIKGESPLHLACTSGSKVIVKVLLNAFPSCEDMIDCDGNTALHLAAKNGHTALVELLLDHGSKVSNNWHGENVLDISLKWEQNDVVCLLASRDDWKLYLHEPGSKVGRPQLPQIIQMVPIAGANFLDHFLTEVEDEISNKSNVLTDLFNHTRKKGLRIKTIFERLDIDKNGTLSRDEIRQGLNMMGSDLSDHNVDHVIDLFDKNGDGEINLCELYEKLPQKSNNPFKQKIANKLYNFRYLIGQGKENPLQVLVKGDVLANEEALQCVHHPVVDKLLSVSWSHYGCYFYMSNCFLFFLFLSLLTSLIIFEVNDKVDWESTRKSFSCDNKSAANLTMCGAVVLSENTEIAIVLMIMLIIQMFKEVYQLITQGLVAYFVFDNLIEWSVYISSFLFTVGCFPGTYRWSEFQMQSGSIAIFLAWLDFILFLQLIPLFGIYVHMIKILLGTLLKVIWMLIIFTIAFGLAFYAIKHTAILFGDAGVSIITTSIMSFGELNYQSSYIENFQNYSLALTLLLFFCLLILIILNNLLIGLAVGDVDDVRKIAKVKQQAMEIELYLHTKESWIVNLLGDRVFINEYMEKNDRDKPQRLLEWVKRFLHVGQSFVQSRPKDGNCDIKNEVKAIKKDVACMKETLTNFMIMLESATKSRPHNPISDDEDYDVTSMCMSDLSGLINVYDRKLSESDEQTSQRNSDVGDGVHNNASEQHLTFEHSVIPLDELNLSDNAADGRPTFV